MLSILLFLQRYRRRLQHTNQLTLIWKPRNAIPWKDQISSGTLQALGLEIIAIIISTGAIVSVIALLHRENGRPISAWKLAVTLNTIVAALGTLARTTLAFALSACVGQQRWSWLRRRPDSLLAWERFDEASRGPWGGTQLLIWLRAR